MFAIGLPELFWQLAHLSKVSARKRLSFYSSSTWKNLCAGRSGCRGLSRLNSCSPAQILLGTHVFPSGISAVRLQLGRWEFSRKVAHEKMKNTVLCQGPRKNHESACLSSARTSSVTSTSLSPPSIARNGSANAATKATHCSKFKVAAEGAGGHLLGNRAGQAPRCLERL